MSKRKTDNISSLERFSKSSGGYFEGEIFNLFLYGNPVYQKMLENIDKPLFENKITGEKYYSKDGIKTFEIGDTKIFENYESRDGKNTIHLYLYYLDFDIYIRLKDMKLIYISLNNTKIKNYLDFYRKKSYENRNKDYVEVDLIVKKYLENLELEQNELCDMILSFDDNQNIDLLISRTLTKEFIYDVENNVYYEVPLSLTYHYINELNNSSYYLLQEKIKEHDDYLLTEEYCRERAYRSFSKIKQILEDDDLKMKNIFSFI